jgi:putative membrane protein
MIDIAAVHSAVLSIQGAAGSSQAQMSPYGGILMWGGGLIFLIVLILILFFIIRIASTPAGEEAAREKPLDVLRKRYARGEISKEQFEVMRKDIQD